MMKAHNPMVQAGCPDGYRKLMCAMIWQAVKFACGTELRSLFGKYRSKYKIAEERSKAIAYIMGTDFEFDCELLGIDSQIEKIREYITLQNVKECYQISLEGAECMEVVDA
jgi:hypothetical protein